MKTLIVYYSFTGNNEALALEMQHMLKCDIYKIHEMKGRTALRILLELYLNRKAKIQGPVLSLEEYRRVILIAPVWDGRIATPMKSFIELKKDELSGYSFITLCSGRPGQTEKIRQQLISLSGKQPAAVTELKVNDLLPPEKRNKIRYTTPYRVKKPDLDTFRPELEHFLAEI